MKRLLDTWRPTPHGKKTPVKRHLEAYCDTRRTGAQTASALNFFEPLMGEQKLEVPRPSLPPLYASVCRAPKVLIFEGPAWTAFRFTKKSQRVHSRGENPLIM